MVFPAWRPAWLRWLRARARLPHQINSGVVSHTPTEAGRILSESRPCAMQRKMITEMREIPRGTFFLELQISFFFLNRHHHTTANVSTPTLTQPTTQRRQHIPTHTDMYRHNQTQTPHPFPAQIQAHFIPSGTRLA